ncbi:adenine phosphoribosyltransferase [Altererythrobacter sp. SALINAS58]|uniref:adenine phosphoribosyltransferase n=1 Tax=Alteripontixanthobacter muriae TaxID=2705546 RepID=UPI0015772121|nr:adenine phosphoribosyltransferase [Alteripontixanthobacter muriae]NTZ43438.1 adenine phosphoribosyltransferase [Alteripontixanthobacter muriae]
MSLADLKAFIRTVPDFPVSGVKFRDITTLIADGAGLSSAIRHLAERLTGHSVTAIAGMEARGFIFGAAVAAELGIGFLPVRKPGKLPGRTISVAYALEYGDDRLELDPDTIRQGSRVAIVDDLIATGGTALAATALLRKAGAIVDRAEFVIDLPHLGGASQLREAGVNVDALVSFAGD